MGSDKGANLIYFF